ncbi:MAG: peptidyl-prolyl cis-trans isomerase [bacterium]|nr:peptidyl-prolyl cis-trans isomerase [bacterium]
MFRRIVLLSITLIAVLAVFGCSGGSDSTQASDEVELAARVDDWTFTRDQIEILVSQMTPQQLEEYDTPMGRVFLADRMIDEELYYKQALKEGLDTDEHFKTALDNYKRTLLVQSYYSHKIEPLARASEEDLYDYYEQNQEAYTIQPIVRAQHIFSENREKLEDFKKRIAAGEKMTTLAHKYSEDALTRDDGGDLGYFNPGGYIRGIGYSEIITDACFTLEPKIVHGPIKWEKGYSLIRVNEFRPATVRSFEEVRKEIGAVFVRMNIDKIKVELVKQLRTQYDVVNYLEKDMKLTQRTPEELWNLAQTSTDSRHRIRNYEEIVQRFPRSDFSPQALFMIGFVYSEEIQDRVEAERWLSRVINEYPDSKVAETAQWMIDNLGKPMPDFDSIDDLKDKVN